MEPTATTTTPGDLLTQRSARRLPRIRLRHLIFPAVVLAGVGVLGGLAVELRHQTQATNTQLAGVRAELYQAQRSLHQAQVLLRATVAQSDGVQHSLDAATAQLHNVQNQLSKAELSSFISANNIAAAQACLGGVRIALNQLALGNGNAAVASLAPVSQQCQTALAG